MNLLLNYSGHMDWRCAMFNLFERRLGYTIYSPIDSWGCLELPRGIHMAAMFDPPCNKDGVQYLRVKRDDYHVRLITFEQFMSMHFDLIVVGNTFAELAFLPMVKKYKPASIFIRQIANVKEKPERCKNVLTTTLTEFGEDVRVFRHYMEPPAVFQPVKPGTKQLKIIKSFSNNLRGNPIDSKLWDYAKTQLADFDFYMHGVANDDGWVDPNILHTSMQEAMFAWHTKPSTGGGFSLQESLACGKPTVVKKEYSTALKTGAQNYLSHGINCIDLSEVGIDEGLRMVREWAEPANYVEKTKGVMNHYKTVFDFEREAEAIQLWIGSLEPGV